MKKNNRLFRCFHKMETGILLKDFLLLLCLSSIFIGFYKGSIPPKMEEIHSHFQPAILPQWSPPPLSILQCYLPDPLPRISFKEQKTTFAIQWGQGNTGIGMIGYTPDACNGMSGGAIPTQIQVCDDGSFWVADGFGPRLVLFSPQGKILSSFFLPEMRREQYQGQNSLQGFTFSILGDDVYVFNTRTSQIFFYTISGEYKGCLSLRYMFEDPEALLEVQPFFRVEEGPFFSVIAIIKKNALYTELIPQHIYSGSIQEEALSLYGFEDVPVTSSITIGLVVNSTARIIETFDPLQEEGYWSQDVQTKMISPSLTTETTQEFSFCFQQTRYKENIVQEAVRAAIREPNWQGGGLIGTDKQNRIYYWVDSSTIGVVAPLFTQDPLLQIQYMELPPGSLHPVAVMPQGGIMGMRLGKKQIEVSIFSIH